MLGLVIDAEPAHATGGWAWAHQPTEASYTAVESWSHNSSGQGVTINRITTGFYQVNFPGLNLSSGGNVQVAAYGSGNEYCVVASWGGITITVRCFGQNGLPVDTAFVASWSSQLFYPDTRTAYLWTRDTAGNPGSATYVWNSSGSAVTSFRVRTGEYVVQFKNLGPLSKIGWTVTAYGTEPRYCSAHQASGCVTDFCDVEVGVTCFSAGGNKADTQFSIIATNHAALESTAFGFARRQGSSFFAFQGWPFLFWTFEGGAVIRSMPTDGSETVTFSDLISMNRTMAMVSSSSPDNRCKVGAWGTAGKGTNVRVRCFGHDGSPSGWPQYNLFYGTTQVGPAQ